MRFSVQQVHWPAVEFPELRGRKVDVVLGRLPAMPIDGHVAEDIDAEVLFNDPFSVVVGESSKWAHSKNVGLADLNDEPWICTPLDVLTGRFLAEAFELQELKAPIQRSQRPRYICETT